MAKPERAENSHESYGVLSFKRSSQSRRVRLFGSPLRHAHTVSFTLSRAVEMREPGMSRFHPTNLLIEAEMSEVQFARLITGAHTGGVPVTIRFEGGRLCEEPPAFNERSRVGEELKAKVESIAGDFDDDVAEIERLFGEKGNVGKGARDAILKKLRSMQQRLRSGVPYLHEQFEAATEETVAEAVAEVAAHAREAAGRGGEVGVGARALLAGEESPAG